MNRFANLDPKKREQYLMILCGLMLAVAVIPMAIYLFGSDVSNKKKEIAKTKAEIEDLELRRLTSGKLTRQIRQDSAKALPATSEIVATEYKNWLATLAQTSRFEGAQVNNTGTTVEQARAARRQGGKQEATVFYTNHKYSLSGKTTLAELGRFLQRFYEADTLHLIRSMRIKPIDNNQRVDVTMSIEAISIPQTANKTFEAKRKENDETPYSQWIAAVVARNFFSPYVRPREVGDPPPPGETQRVVVSASKHTYLNGITWSKNRPQAWFNFRLEGRQGVLQVGDRFRVGETNCVLESVDADTNTVEVRVESRNSATNRMERTVWSLMVGDTFADADFVRDLDEDEEQAASVALNVS